MHRLWLPLGCGALQLVSVSTGSSAEPAAWASAVGSGLALGAGLALLGRHRAPVLVLAVATLGQAGQVLLDRPVLPVVATVAAFVVARHALLTAGSPVGPAAALAAFVVARHALLTAGSPVGPAAALAASVLTVATTIALAGHADLAAIYALLLLLGVLVGLALAVRATRAAAQRRELVLGERLRIARDLHDTVGHGVGAITVQAGAGRLAVAAGATQEATRALQAIEEAGRAVLRDVRWMVGLLREEQERPRLRDVRELVVTARRSGLEVTLQDEGDVATASDDVGEVAYRIVQEAITNVLRHSTSRRVHVRVAVTDDVEVDVRDEGAAVEVPAGRGNGLHGMQERARSVGGDVRAGPEPAGGWAVRARLPATGRAR